MTVLLCYLTKVERERGALELYRPVMDSAIIILITLLLLFVLALVLCRSEAEPIVDLFSLNSRVLGMLGAEAGGKRHPLDLLRLACGLSSADPWRGRTQNIRDGRRQVAGTSDLRFQKACPGLNKL